jgi:hypothetical protein
MANLESALAEAIVLNREEAKREVAGDFEEITISG